MRASFPDLVSGNRVYLYPDLQPLTGGKREGTLDVFVDAKLNALLLNSSLPLAPPGKTDAQKPAADFRFDFRDQKPAAAIRVTPRPVLVHWRGKHAITLAEEKATLQFRWEAEPIVGTPETFDFRFAPGFPARWKIKSEDGALPIHHWERLDRAEISPHVFLLPGVHGELLEQILPTGSLWRFHLSEPLRKKAHFTIEASLPAGFLEEQTRRLSLMMPRADAWGWLGIPLAVETAPKSKGSKAWVIPLAAPLERDMLEQEIAVDSPLEPIHKITADGSLVVRSAAGPAEKAPFHYQLHQGSGPPFAPASTIHLWTQPEKRATSLLEWCDEANVTSYLRKDGAVFHRVHFRLWHWHDRAFDMRFPKGFEIVAVRLHETSLERLDVRADDDGVRLTLPFDQNSPFVRYEICVRERPRGQVLPGWLKVEVPALDWPIAPMDVRKRVCLENGWTPIAPAALTPIGVPARIASRSETLDWLGKAWSWGQAWWPLGTQAQRIEMLDKQRETVLTKEGNLRGDGLKKPMKLAAVMELFALVHLKDAAPLILDASAMNGLGLSGETMLAPADLSPQARRPFWEKLGLIYVPCSRGALLTSPARMQQLGLDGRGQTAELDNAIEEAILHGHDTSGGFYLVLPWLKVTAADSVGSPGATSFPIGAYRGDFQDMTEWEVSGPEGRAVLFYVIDPGLARVLGALFAILLALLAWKVQRAIGPVSCFRAHVVLLTAGILVFFLTPAAIGEYFLLPALLTACASFIVCLIRLALTRNAAGPNAGSTIARPAAGTVLGLLLLSFALGAVAQAPVERVYPIYIIDGAKPAALVPTDVIAKLDAFENQSVLGASGAVLLRSKYTGTVKDALAKFDVEYDLHSFKDQTKLVIPLAGVQLLEGATVDKTPVFPNLHKIGFVVPIKGKGPHRLRLSFTTRLKDLGDHVELAFAVPKLVQNEMSVAWSAPVQTFHCQNCWGEEKAIEEAGKALKHWQGQIGYEKEVNLRLDRLRLRDRSDGKDDRCQGGPFLGPPAVVPRAVDFASLYHRQGDARAMPNRSAGGTARAQRRGVRAAAGAAVADADRHQELANRRQRRPAAGAGMIVDLAQPTTAAISLT